jgi:cytidylate kinase
MGIVGINQQLGSRGMELGQMAASELGWRFMSGDQLLSATAAQFGVSDEAMRMFDIHTPHFWERNRAENERHMIYYRAVIMKVFAERKIVVVGRSSAFFVPANSGGLRMRAIAPIAARAAAYAAAEKLSEPAALRRLAALDEEINARAQNLYGLDATDPVHYDAVINTARTPIGILAKGVAAMAAQADAETSDAQRAAVNDGFVAAAVHAALEAHPKIHGAGVSVVCLNGNVRVSGQGMVAPWDELVMLIARGVEGVAQVAVSAEEPAPSNLV